MDSAGKSFNILAYTLNVSSSGARIGGVKVPLGVGDAVTVQYKQQRALFKVVWIGRPGDPTQEQVGLTLLEQDRQIWAEIDDSRTFLDDYVGKRSHHPSPPPPPPAAPTQEPPVPIEVAEAAEDAALSAEAVPQEALRVLTVFQSPRDPDELVRACARGLLHIEKVVKRTPPNVEALQEFRDAIAKTRQTVWALQQWHEVKDEGNKAFPLLAYLNSERLRFVVQAVQDLADDMATKGVEVDAVVLNKFFRSVEQLRSRAANPTTEPQGFSLEVIPPDAEPGTRAIGATAIVQAVKAAAAEVHRSGMTTAAASEFLAREMQRILGADGVAIARLQAGEMVCVGSSGNASETGVVLETECGLGGEAMRTRELAYCHDTQSDARVDAGLCKTANIGSVAIVPLQSAGGAPAAMIEVSTARTGAFGPTHLDGLRASAEVIHAILGERGPT
jgi:hypothetical protein